MDLHTRSIAIILETIRHSIQNDLEGAVVSIPTQDRIDPDKFNRAEIAYEGRLYTASVFVSGQRGYPEEIAAAPAVIPTLPSSPPVFETDYRVSNPGLHKLYVGYALETILVAKKACKKLYAQSRWPASALAGTLWEQVQEEMLRDAAWFEAAALIASKVDLAPYLPQQHTVDVTDKSQEDR